MYWIVHLQNAQLNGSANISIEDNTSDRRYFLKLSSVAVHSNRRATIGDYTKDGGAGAI